MLRGKEGAAHRRTRKKRSQARTPRVAEAALILGEHHGSQPPRLIAQALQFPLASTRTPAASIDRKVGHANISKSHFEELRLELGNI